MRTQSIQLAFLVFTALSLTACGEAYFDEDTNQLVGAVESVGTDPYQNQEELWWLLSCNEGDYACNCQVSKSGPGSGVADGFLTMDTTVAASTALRESTASVIPVLGANGSMDGSRGNTASTQGL